jgi:crotonobetainyl-CoA:carnitine CoA-transferase CaiB-like acyl-CoA transferase
MALRGLKVIECATVIAAPLCGRLLADFGADVIHIEHPKTGDHLRQFGFTVNGVNPWWKYYARNKKLVTLDISKSKGREVLYRLLSDADVFIENFRPGRLEEWGITYDDLAKINPRLIMVRVTGFGQTGPYSSQPGFGTVIEGMSGFAEMTGEPDGPPIIPQFALADSYAGLYAAAATMFAIYHRDVLNHGRGQVIDVSILESLFGMLGPNALVYHLTGKAPRRTGNRTGTTAPRNVYRTKDERWVALAGSTQSTAVRLLKAIGRPELAEDPRFSTNAKRVENVDALDEIVGGWMRAHARDDIVAMLRAAEVPIGPINDIADLMNNEQVRARQMIVDVPDGEGAALPMEGVFPRMQQTPGSIRHAGGGIGADNREIYLERLGLTAEQIEELKQAGII